MIQIKRQSFLKIFFYGLIVIFYAIISANGKTAAISDSLNFKIGQMIMVGFRGLDIDEDLPIAKDIGDLHIGGVILFDYDIPGQSPIRNIQSPDQLKRLTNQLQALTSTPLLIAVDYEGGQITRLKEKFGFPPTFSVQELGEKNDPKFTQQQAKEMALTLKQMGVNLNLAPVVDLNINPQNPIIGKLKRSYSSDPEIVTTYADQFIRSHHENGILCTLKHFPGHGSSKGDTHKKHVDITETWSEIELIPYRKLIQSGKADAIMTAHLFNQNIDDQFPATLSYPTIMGILRNQLDYDGVVISDDLQMKAILDNYDLETTIYQAIHAGVDILLFANNSIYEQDIGARSVQIIRKLISDKKISESRIEESYLRIQNMKSRLK